MTVFRLLFFRLLRSLGGAGVPPPVTIGGAVAAAAVYPWRCPAAAYSAGAAAADVYDGRRASEVYP